MPSRDSFVCGAHSNIPLCCQIFYDSVWDSLRKKTLPKGEQVSEGHFQKDGQTVYKFGWKGDWLHSIGYVLCPECIVRMMQGRFKPHIVKSCNCGK